MANICNKLEKLPPPAFVTTRSLNKRLVLQQWNIIKHQSNYLMHFEILSDEFRLLSGYIDRKGTQLRLEKALMLTRQIQKLSVRWKSNELISHLETFRKAIGIVKKGSKGKRPADATETDDQRLPSSQWATWLIYLTMRDAILLAKISLECENAVKFWLGLIASGHHWGDSLVVSALLSRLWYTAAKAVKELTNTVFPALQEIQMLLQPSAAGLWPSDEFKVPSNLLNWIRKDMKLPFRGAADRDQLTFAKYKEQKTNFIEKYLGSIEAEHGDIEEELERQLGDPSEGMGSEPGNSHNESKRSLGAELEEDLGAAVSSISDLGFFIDVKGNVEDFGMPVGKKKKLGNVKKGKSRSFKNVKADVLSVSPWKKFFANVEVKLTTVKGRKILKGRCKQLLLSDDQDPKVKIKIKKIRKALIALKDGQKGDVSVDDVQSQYDKLKVILSKREKSS